MEKYTAKKDLEIDLIQKDLYSKNKELLSA